MRFEQAFGVAGGRPESYWQPFLGDHCGLRPADLNDISCEQLVGCLEYAQGE